jgi:hypothetical protein
VVSLGLPGSIPVVFLRGLILDFAVERERREICGVARTGPADEPWGGPEWLWKSALTICRTLVA